jgi:hypothetical protein
MRESTAWLVGPLLGIVLAVPGCIGIVGVGDQESELKYEEKDYIESNSFKDRHGKPARIELDNGKELWTYEDQVGDRRWRGVVLLSIIPLPLIVPVGYDNTTYIVEKGRIVSKLNRESQFIWGGLCGYIWHPHSSDNSGFHCAM